jgi:uroporphyrinogen-III synthase
LRVLISRPAHFAHQQGRLIEQNQFIADIFPVIELAPTPKQTALVKAVQGLNTTDIVIFVSRSAVKYGMNAINTFWFSNSPHRLSLLWAAIGPGTKQALEECGVQVNTIVSPLMAPYESESLLTHPDLQHVQEKRILIFQGNTGRQLLHDTLVTRGADVSAVECYQRRLPVMDMAAHLAQWQNNPPDITLATSAEGLYNLVSLVGPLEWTKLRDLPMIVVSVRIQALAATLGVRQVLLAKGADDQSILEALIKIRDTSK